MSPIQVVDVTRHINRLRQGKHPTGVDRVGLAWLRHFSGGWQAGWRIRHRLVVFNGWQSRLLFSIILNGSPAFWLPWLKWSRYFWQLLFGWLHIHTDGLYINLVHSGLEDDPFMADIRRQGLKGLYFIHDLIPVSHPQFCRAGEQARHVTRLVNALTTARLLVVNSADTQNQLQTFARTHHLPLPSVQVVPLAIEDGFIDRALASSSGRRDVRDDLLGLEDTPFFLTVGTIEPRKNHAFLLDIWKKLLSAPVEPVPVLIIIGQQGWDSTDMAARICRMAAETGKVCWIKDCSDNELAFLLGRASGVLFPSHVEGFGIPVLEARWWNTPVIANNLPVYREFTDSGIHLVDTQHSHVWEALVRHYAGCNSPYEKQLGWLHNTRPVYHRFNPVLSQSPVYKTGRIPITIRSRTFLSHREWCWQRHCELVKQIVKRPESLD